jgi:hypothetical protein
VKPCVISCIVEGHGESQAVPILVRRIAEQVDSALDVRVPKPIRVPKDKLLKDRELERYIELAAGSVDDKGGVFILVDADDDCPGKKGPELLHRAQDARSDLVVGVVMAKREFEAWFIAGAASLRGRRGFPADLEAPCEPEEIRGAKEWLRKRMEGGHTYSETVDQPALTATLDLSRLRELSASFDKCWREVARLLQGS